MPKKEPTTIFGRRLREARLRSGIPQDKLGVAIGLDEGTASARISRYETGIHEPPYGVAVKLAKVLRVPTAYFYCDDELAELVLVWGELTKSERRRVKSILDTELAAKSSR